ncbi:substrate-binding domain-containing protein [Luteolibacter arcticus]|uniref:Substrate-binding domain-containing protein n=1 Tax=Luteolibacter arcticus TaxID=1581411 RepID=A0ABT3GQQ0_9BACT|nr:substrate-binding domain-containing protein [Luteolibacter arcticus]MCW1925788.1 substrate-binding domain-containing protein [Luteolibacter arcticus]
MTVLLALAILGVSQIRADNIRLGGSDLLGAKLVPMFCEEYVKQHPEMRFEIAAEGSFGALPDFLAGKTDILMASKALDGKRVEPFEKAGIVLKRVDAVTAVTVLVVNEENPVGDLSLAQLEGLFAGDHANWKAVGGLDAPVSLYARNTASSTYRDFQLAAMSGRPYAKGALKLPGGESPGMMVVKDPNGITYLSPLFARQNGLAVIKIDGVDPLGNEVRRYPLLRPAYYYHRKDARAEVLALVRWMSASPEAREIATRIGFLFPEEVPR